MKRIAAFVGVLCLFAAAYLAGVRHSNIVYAQSSSYPHSMTQGTVPKSYGHIVSAIADSIGTGLVFEDESGVIRFVSVTGMKEGELARYDQTPTHGGIPKSYGRLVAAVARSGSTALVFESSDGVIRFVTITGVVESELKRE
jgi:hypothetical protein